MPKPPGSYNGGQNGSGVYQQLINLIPPIDTFITGFAGHCGVLSNMRPARKNIVIDMSAKVISRWTDIYPLYMFYKADTRENLPRIISQNCDLSAERVLVFLDPPYLDETRSSKQNYYEYEMRKEEDHVKLCDMLSLLDPRVMVMLTHYPCSFYDDRLVSWNKKDIKVTTHNGSRIARIYFNYPSPLELHDYSYFVTNNRQREKYTRIKKNLISKLARLEPGERNYLLDTIRKEFLNKSI